MPRCQGDARTTGTAGAVWWSRRHRYRIGIRVAPGFPAPKGGYGYDPDYLRHWTGYKGELELKNRIEKAVPYEKIVHYGNSAGDQGPDVLTIGPDNRFMEWDSRSRMAKRRLGPSMARSASLKLHASLP